MTWLNAAIVFVVIWWLVFFMTLPWGVRPPEEPGEGHVPSAPKRPMLWRKALAATAIAALVFAGVYWVVAADLITLRAPAPPGSG